MATDPAKLKDYTSRGSEKRVRRASKPEKAESTDILQHPVENK